MILNFNNEIDIQFFNDSNKLLKNKITNDEKVFDTIIMWLNRKLCKAELHLFTIPYDIKDIENIYIKLNNTKNFNNKSEKDFYLSSGELLALFYILNIKNLREEDIISINQNPIIITSKIKINTNNNSQLCSAEEVANFIIENSTYNINFLPKNKFQLAHKYVFYIKKGFSLIYKIAMKYKDELLYLVKSFSDYKKFNLSAAMLKIQALSLNDMETQLFLINEKFSDNSDYKISSNFSKNKISKDLDKQKLIPIVCRIGDHIIERSIITYRNSNLERTWIDTSENGIIKPMDSSLYYGNSGVALFFVYLGYVTNKQYFIFAAKEAIYPVLRVIEQDGFDNFNYLDIISILYTILKIYDTTYDIRIKEFIDNNLYGFFEFSTNTKIFKEVYNIDISIELNCFNIAKSETLEKLLEKILFLEIILYKKYEDKLFSHLSTMMSARLILNTTYPSITLLDKNIEELIKTINNDSICNNIYYTCGNLIFLNYTADTLNNVSLKNISINTLNLIIDTVSDQYKSKKFNLFEQHISFINGLSGLGYYLLNFL